MEKFTKIVFLVILVNIAFFAITMIGTNLNIAGALIAPQVSPETAAVSGMISPRKIGVYPEKIIFTNSNDDTKHLAGVLRGYYKLNLPNSNPYFVTIEMSDGSVCEGTLNLYSAEVSKVFDWSC